MWVRQLSLTNFRNYRRQELSLPQGPVLLLGANAQGKSNLLEAVFLLASARSERAASEGELICWAALDEAQPVARVCAQIERRDGPVEIEVIIAGRPRPGRTEVANPDGARVLASKRLRVNGVAKRQIDVAGQVAAVLFTTGDLDLIGGPPAERRRYLDVMLSQVERAYAQALPRYNKAITQRNALLRRLQEHGGDADELLFWDDELARHGAQLISHRAAAIETLAKHARRAHGHLSGGREELSVAYRPRLDWDGKLAGAKQDALARALREALAAGRRRDIGAGLTLTGPHRDDLTFALDGVAAASFASRGQQRTAALALRLAEARLMAERKGDLPVVLLDDVLPELDEARRRAVLASLGEWEQLLITSADGDRFADGLTPAAAFRIVSGAIGPL
jgi:DNA replication and repair protein RecF